MLHGLLMPIALMIFLLSALLIIKALSGTAGSAKAFPPPFVAKPLLTEREAAMLLVLEDLLPAARIHAQVAMGALLRVAPVPGRRSLPSDRNRFARKIVDFVVQDRATGKVIALIEVDDFTHRPDKDLARDAMTAAAGYRTIRIPMEASASPPSVRPTIAEIIDPLSI